MHTVQTTYVLSIYFWFQKDQQFKRYDWNSHALTTWALTVTVTLKTASQFLGQHSAPRWCTTTQSFNTKGWVLLKISSEKKAEHIDRQDRTDKQTQRFQHAPPFLPPTPQCLTLIQLVQTKCKQEYSNSDSAETNSPQTTHNRQLITDNSPQTTHKGQLSTENSRQTTHHGQLTKDSSPQTTHKGQLTTDNSQRIAHHRQLTLLHKRFN